MKAFSTIVSAQQMVDIIILTQPLEGGAFKGAEP